MSTNFVTNITHFFEENGATQKRLSKETRKIAEGLGKVIVCVTKKPRKTPKTDVQCWNKVDKKQCTGEIDAGIDLNNFNILWDCQKCGSYGSISSWENTFWDRGYR